MLMCVLVDFLPTRADKNVQIAWIYYLNYLVFGDRYQCNEFVMTAIANLRI